MNPMMSFLEHDRTLVGRLAGEPDRVMRKELIAESIRSGETAISGSNNPADVANAMLSVGASHLLAVVEEESSVAQESHARRGSAWAELAVRAAGQVPGAILFFAPRAATLVASALPYLPVKVRQNSLDQIDVWAKSTTVALESQHLHAEAGTRDLVVGLTLLEGSHLATNAEAPGVHAEAISMLERAKRSLTAAGETELASEAAAAIRGEG